MLLGDGCEQQEHLCKIVRLPATHMAWQRLH